MKKQQKIFLFVGFPFIAFFRFIISITLVIMGTFMTVFVIVFIIGFCLNKKDRALNFTKLGILLFLIFFIMYPNIFDWGNQISRRIDKHQLITSNSPKIAILNNSFYDWYSKYNDTYFGVSSTTNFNDLNEILQVKLVQFFIYNHSNPNQIIDYSYDFMAPSRWAYDHLATVDEILNANATHGTDDCDGIAVVTCSLLIYMGYDAYIAEGDFHWWTIVFFNGTRYWNENNPVMLNWWPEVGKPYYLFNEKYTIFPQPLPISMLNVLSETGNYVYGDFYYDVLIGKYINPILAWIAIISIFLLLSIGIQYFLIIPRRWKFKKADLTEILFGWSTITIIGITLFFLVHFNLAIYGHLLVFTSLTVIIFSMSQKLPQKLPFFRLFVR